MTRPTSVNTFVRPLVLGAVCLGLGSAAHAKTAAVCKPQGVFTVNEKGLRGLAVSKDGTTLFVGGVDKDVRALDARTGKVLRTFKGHTAEVYAVALSPDGKVLASGGDDKKLLLWDAQTARLLATLEGHQNSVRGLAFTPDGVTLLSASLDRQLGSWDVATRKGNGFLGGQACVLMGVATSTGTLKSGAPAAATACNDGLVRLWDLKLGKPKVALEAHHGEVHAVAFSPQGANPLLASGDNDGKVVLWDVQQQKAVSELEAAWVDVVVFSPDGALLVGAGNDGAMKGLFRLWNVVDGKLLNEQSPHDGNITGAAFAPGGKALFTISMDGTAKSWDVAQLKKGCG